MKCPVCGSKMVNGKVCRYCNVTSDQVINASNKKAKNAKKQKINEEVCYSSYLPSDVNKRKLLLLTIFLGVFGAGSFYVGKYVKAWFALIASVLAIAIALVDYFNKYYGWGAENGISIIFNLVTFFAAINVILWFDDIISSN
jgi:TM2 domain-containing membrane protein YozV